MTKTGPVSRLLIIALNHSLMRTSFGRKRSRQFEFGNPWTKRFRVMSMAAVYRIGAFDISLIAF